MSKDLQILKIDLQLFGGRGTGSYSGSASFGGGGGGFGGDGEDLPVAGWTPDAGSRYVDGAKTMNSAESRIQNLNHEQAVVVDKNGYVVAVVDGEEHSVGLTARARNAIKNGGTLTHNHPNGGTFSDTDIISAGTMGAKEIRAVSKSTGKSYSLKAGNHADGAGLAKAMRKDSDKIIKTVNAKLDKTVNKRKYTSKENFMKAVNRVYDEEMGGWLKTNGAKYGYTYSEIKTGSYKG